MNNKQTRALSPTNQPNRERISASSIQAEMELGVEELSNVSGGRGLMLVCASGRHIPRVKITL
jgi:hypothetical protein